MITRLAAARSGYPPTGVAALLETVRAPDMDEMMLGSNGRAGLALRLKPSYRSAHHCDRTPDTTDERALAQALRYVSRCRDRAQRRIEEGDVPAAIRALGAALHAAQDCLSHTDAVERGQVTVDALVASIVDRRVAPPDVQVVAVDRRSRVPGRPDARYPHDRHAKDHWAFNDVARTVAPDGHSYFEIARDAAVDGSDSILREFLEPLDRGQREAVGALRAADVSTLPWPLRRWRLTATAAVVTVLSAVGWLGLRRRRC